MSVYKEKNGWRLSSVVSIASQPAAVGRYLESGVDTMLAERDRNRISRRLAVRPAPTKKRNDKDSGKPILRSNRTDNSLGVTFISSCVFLAAVYVRPLARSTHLRSRCHHLEAPCLLCPSLLDWLPAMSIDRVMNKGRCIYYVAFSQRILD